MKHIITYTFLFMSLNLFSQQTVGLFNYQSSTEEGYVLISPFFSTDTYLIDNCGRQINHWESEYFPAAATILLENGHLLRTSGGGPATNPVFPFGGGGQHIQEVDWDGVVVWEFTYSDSTHRMHHDFVRLPNGNILIPAWELKTKSEAIEAGRDSTLIPDNVLWAEYLIEVNPTTDSIIWEWHLWDHLIQDYDSTKSNFGVVAEHPELFNINNTGGPTINGERNWLHINAIAYNSNLDQIILNSFFLSEFFIIDHSTTLQEAASPEGGNSGKGGDLLYRWGNPQNYDHGDQDDRKIFGAHNVQWIENGLEGEGKIMLFNNGNNRPDGSYSSVDIISPPLENSTSGLYTYTEGEAYMPEQKEWTYTATPPESFYSNFVSSAQRMSNGNTMICSGANGRFFEIDENKEIVWEYISPVINTGIVSQGDTIPLMGGRKTNVVFRSPKYNIDFEGFDNLNLDPGDPLELNFTEPYDCEIISSIDDIENNTPILVYPNPANNTVHVELNGYTGISLKVFNSIGKLYHIESIGDKTSINIDISLFETGLYFIQIDKTKVQALVIGQ